MCKWNFIYVISAQRLLYILITRGLTAAMTGMTYFYTNLYSADGHVGLAALQAESKVCMWAM